MSQTGRLAGPARQPVAAAPPADPALERLASLAARALRVPAAWLLLVGPDGTLQGAASSGGFELPEDAGFLCRAVITEGVAEARPVILEDALSNGSPEVRVMLGSEPARFFAVFPVRADGEVLGALCLADRMPRRLAEDEQTLLEELARYAGDSLNRLQKAEQATRDHDRLFALSSDLICVADAEGRFKKVNAAWQKVLGYPPEEMIGKRSIDFVHPDDLERTRTQARQLVRGEPGGSFENRYRHKAGGYRWLLWSSAAFLEEGAYYAIARDITAWRDAQDTIGQYAKQVGSILESITDALFTLDHDWRFTYLNPQAVAHLARDDLVGKNFWEEFPAALGTTFEREYRRAMENKQATTFDAYYAPLKSWFEVRAYPLDEGLSVYFQNVTERKTAEQALKEANEFKDKVMASVNEGIMALDLQGRFTLANRRLHDMLAQDEVMGLSLLEFAPRETQAQLKAMFETAARGKVVPAFETVLLNKHAQALIVNLSFAPLVADSSIGGVVATALDITETKATLDRLRLLNQAIEHVDEVVIITEARAEEDGPQIVYVNDAFCTTTGYSKTEAIGQPLRLLEGPESDPNVLKDFREAQKHEASFTARTINYRKDGSSYLVDWHASPVRDAQGRLTHWASVQTKVSERAEFEATIVELNASLRQRLAELDQKNEELLRTARLAAIRKQNLEQAASELAKTARQLHTIFALSPDGFLSIDESGKVAYANEAFMRMTGFSPTQVIGKPEQEVEKRLQTLCDPAQPCAPYRVDAETYYDTIHFVRPRPTVLRRMVRTLTAENAELLGRVIYLRDVTHETEVDRMKSEFLSTAAHELRTPMTSIYGFSQLLLARDYDPDTSRELIKTIHDQSARLVQLLNELLDLARIEARAGKDFKMHPQPLVPILRETLRSFANLEKHELRLELPEQLPQVVVDSDKMQQVFTNVISNAIKYSPDGGSITVRAEVHRGEGRVGVHVSDGGIGMTPEQVRRVCERFYRADTSGAIPGTGLGMSLVKEIMDIHGGALEIVSAPGEGTTVTLWLPAEEGV